MQVLRQPQHEQLLLQRLPHGATVTERRRRRAGPQRRRAQARQRGGGGKRRRGGKRERGGALGPTAGGRAGRRWSWRRDEPCSPRLVPSDAAKPAPRRRACCSAARARATRRRGRARRARPRHPTPLSASRSSGNSAPAASQRRFVDVLRRRGDRRDRAAQPGAHASGVFIERGGEQDGARVASALPDRSFSLRPAQSGST